VSTVEQLKGERLVHTIPLSASSELRARLYTFNDVLRADIRLFAYRRKLGQWVPTRRGVSVPATELPALLGAVHALIESERKG